MRFHGTALLAVLLTASCAAEPPAPTPLEVRSLIGTLDLPATWSGLEEATIIRVTRSEDWPAAWERVWAVGADTPALPEVDFSREQVIVVGLGLRPKCGYRVTVESAGLVSETLVLDLLETTPAPSCGYCDSETRPAAVVAIPVGGSGMTPSHRSMPGTCG